jgi:hypothetical protein
MAIVYFRGRVFATPSACTALIEGVEVHGGQVGAGQPLDTEITLFSVDTAGGATSISVTSGVITVGPAYVSTAVPWTADEIYQQGMYAVNAGSYYLALSKPPKGTPVTNTTYWQAVVLEDTFGPDECTNILINGQAPEWPATPVDPMPGGSPQNPDWSGWFFEVSAGETITFNVTP